MNDFNKCLRKGKIGEDMVKSYLKEKGFVIYPPEIEGPHAFDFLAIKDKENCIVGDVKTYKKMTLFPYKNTTGVDTKHFDTYIKFSMNHKIDFWIFFVDEIDKLIYRGKLEDLEKPYTDQLGNEYPKTIDTWQKGPKRIWSMESMEEVVSISEEKAKELSDLNQRSYAY